jgi:glucosylglycerate synthase
MAEANMIAESARPAIQQRSTADVLIAVTTFNNESTIGAVLKAARTALLQFPQYRGLILQMDGGSDDATIKRAKEALPDEVTFAQERYPLYPLHRLQISHHSVPGKDNAYRAIFTLSKELDAKACCIVGGDAMLTPDWIASLIQPVLETGFDLAAPSYRRHKYDGLLVSGILYPVLRALFGKRIRQPIGNDFAYSRGLIRQCLSMDTWGSEAARRDIDFWITLCALEQNLKICQVNLGSRPQSSQAGEADLGAILSKLAGVTYLEMERTAELWQRVRGSTPVAVFGLRFDPENEVDKPNAKPMIDAYRIGYKNLQDIWGLVLPPAALLELKRMSRQSDEEFRFGAELWARTVYDFAIAHRLRHIGRDHLLQALIPLYLGWVASFVLTVAEANFAQAEEQLERVCLAYESQKPYLISRWRWPDRFMP